MGFYLSESQEGKFRAWDAEHYPTCQYYDDGKSPASPQGAIGGRLTYMFTPNSVGMVSKVECACGAKIDLTNYDEW